VAVASSGSAISRTQSRDPFSGGPTNGLVNASMILNAPPALLPRAVLTVPGLTALVESRGTPVADWSYPGKYKQIQAYSDAFRNAAKYDVFKQTENLAGNTSWVFPKTGQLNAAARGIDVPYVLENGDMYYQVDDGQVARVLDRGNGTSDFVIVDFGNPSGEHTTAIKVPLRWVNERINDGRWQ
jgi:hypothetical protein